MKQPTVSIVGSFRRHYEAVVQAAEIFTAAGMTVLSPAVSRIINPGGEFVRFERDSPDSADHEIQAATMSKILASDFVYVVAPDGYVGRTTCYELGSVLDRDIPVYYSEPPKDLPVLVSAATVLSPRQLVESMRGGELVTRRPRLVTQMTADLVVLTVREECLHVLLVTRATEPFKGWLALPGGFMREGESLDDSASRELGEETGLDAATLPFEQLRTYSDPERDPRSRRVISTAFLAIAPDLPVPAAATDAGRADWVEVEPSLAGRLAFDHGQILTDGLRLARTELEDTNRAVDFCGPTFTLRELCRVYEAVWGSKVDVSNFRRKVRETGLVQPTGERRKGARGPAAELYRRGPATVLQPPMRRSGLLLPPVPSRGPERQPGAVPAQPSPRRRTPS